MLVGLRGLCATGHLGCDSGCRAFAGTVETAVWAVGVVCYFVMTVSASHCDSRRLGVHIPYYAAYPRMEDTFMET